MSGGDDWEPKDGEQGHASSSYRSSIIRFQKLLKTHLTEEDHDYIKERLSACRAAVKALIGSEKVRK